MWDREQGPSPLLLWTTTPLVVTAWAGCRSGLWCLRWPHGVVGRTTGAADSRREQPRPCSGALSACVCLETDEAKFPTIHIGPHVVLTSHRPQSATNSQRTAASSARSSSSRRGQQLSSSPHGVWTGPRPLRLESGGVGVGNRAVTDYHPAAGLQGTEKKEEKEQGRVQHGSLSIATFNVLAPCYKRMADGGREADFPERMERRARETAAFIREEVAADIICLQEYYLAEQYRRLFETELGGGYDVIVHPRPNKREGCAVLVRKGMFRVQAVKGTTLSRWGSRIGLLVDLQAVIPDSSSTSGGGGGGSGSKILLLNAHLSFPHNRFGGFTCACV